MHQTRIDGHQGLPVTPAKRVGHGIVELGSAWIVTGRSSGQQPVAEIGACHVHDPCWIGKQDPSHGFPKTHVLLKAQIGK
jgi:hypothetical protein